MNTLTMARKKKELTPNRQLAQAILDQYQPKSVEDMQDALKDIFGPMFEAMLQGEMNSHLGYSPLRSPGTVKGHLNRLSCQKGNGMFRIFRIRYCLCMRKE